MDSIEKLIYNTLVSHSGINLPGLGALVMRRQPAQIKGRSTLLPPRNTVAYTTAQAEGTPCVVELLQGVVHDADRAQELYREWLAGHGIAQNRLPATVIIEGVGEISSGSFWPAAPLEKALNPVAGKPIRLSRKLHWGYIVLLSVCALIFGAATYVYFNGMPACCATDNRATPPVAGIERHNPDRIQSATAPDTAALQLATPPADTLAALPAQAATPAAAPATPVTPPAPASVAATSQAPAAAPATPATGPRYHLVMGVYSTPENAAKSIRQLTAKDPDIQCTVVNMPNGKFLVSGFNSTDREQVAARMKRALGRYPDVWIYTQR